MASASIHFVTVYLIPLLIAEVWKNLSNLLLSGLQIKLIDWFLGVTISTGTSCCSLNLCIYVCTLDVLNSIH